MFKDFYWWWRVDVSLHEAAKVMEEPYREIASSLFSYRPRPGGSVRAKPTQMISTVWTLKFRYFLFWFLLVNDRRNKFVIVISGHTDGWGLLVIAPESRENPRLNKKEKGMGEKIWMTHMIHSVLALGIQELNAPKRYFVGCRLQVILWRYIT